MKQRGQASGLGRGKYEGHRSACICSVATDPRVRTPSKAGDATEEWLTAYLAKNVPGAVALSVTPRGGTTGTTDRRRPAVEWNEAAKAAGKPSQLFVKSTPLTAKNRAMVAALDMAVNEVCLPAGRGRVGWLLHRGPGSPARPSVPAASSSSKTLLPKVRSRMHWPTAVRSSMPAVWSTLSPACIPDFGRAHGSQPTYDRHEPGSPRPGTRY